ncbi:MAG: FAD-dependent oxidoreductase, partial [Thermodesulfobacteriota bacterium]
IPEYRLPRDILDGEIEHIRGLGVEIKTSSSVGEDVSVEELFGQGFKALFIATGAYRDLRLNIPGEDGQGVIPGLVFLGRINSGQDIQVGESTAVIGGGNVAIDAARSALRIGSKQVRILYRRSRREMPAGDEEIEEALSEGVDIEYLVAPTEIIPKGKGGMEVRCVRMRLGEPDTTGRRRPIPMEGSEFAIEVDTFIPAIGQAPDLRFISPEMGVELTRGGALQVDPVTLQTSREGVFAGGDAVTGPGIAIEAVHAGKEAAISIHRYLNGLDLREGREPFPWQKANVDDLLAEAQRSPRERAPLLAPERRRDSFQEARLGLTEQRALREAKRCLNCGGCSDCGECAKICQPKAIVYGMEEERIELHVGAIVLATGFDPFDVKLKPEFGYEVYPNVLHGLELERLCSASGPTKGEILIQGKKPKEVVFIQCVGSRDKTVGNEYCSRVCCMYTAKQAHLLREKIPDARITVLYMDVRAFGKGFEEFYERVQKEGIIYRRGNPSEVYRGNGKLVVRGEDTLLGEPFELGADLVVLASGLIPRKEDEVLKAILGLEKSSDRFYAEAPGLDPIVTGVEGIFLAGCCQGPKDIPDTVAQASGAASLTCALLVKGTTVVAET